MQTPRTHRSLPRTTNALLRCLADDDLRRLWPRFERVALKPRRVLHFQDTAMEHAYFIEQGLVSVLASTGPVKSVEVWLIGREGFVGLPIILGETMSVHRRIVQVAGSALRIHAEDLREVVERFGAFRAVLLQYAQTILIQASQLSGCNAHHGVRQRLARWLLMAQDRCGTDTLPLTHEMLSRMLGVRRATVTECIAELEAEEILGRARSEIRIKARRRLEDVACPCYRVVRGADERLVRSCETNRPGGALG
jgi:CRP-like cAMP-binding protein